MFLPSESWGVWVGAIGQVVTAVALLRYSAKSSSAMLEITKQNSKATALKSLNEMFNNWNAMAGSSPQFVAASESLRGKVKDVYTDALVFSYLNCLSSYLEMKNQGLVSADEEQATFRNGIDMLATVSDEHMTKYLSRGYHDEFRERVHKERRHRPS